MPPIHSAFNCRGGSWLFGVGSFAVPVMLYAYHHAQFRQWADQQPDGGVCGMALLGAMVLSVAVALVLSLVALGFGLRGYFKLDAPRPRARRLEALVLGSASIVIVAAAAVAWLVEHS